MNQAGIEGGFFDSHAHYDHPLFEEKGPAILTDLKERGILDKVVIPAIDYETNFQRELFPVEEYPWVYFAAGLHPKRATNEPTWTREKKAQFQALLTDMRTVAVKTGMDYSKVRLMEGQKEHQKQFFRMMIQYANAYKLPLVLHIREAVDDAIEVMKQVPIEVPAVVHCYSYDDETRLRLLEVGVTHFGIGAMMTRDEMGSLRDCIAKMPVEQILLETDAPFVKPQGFEGPVNTSENLSLVLEKIAKLKGAEDVQKLATTIRANTERFYGID